MDGLDQIPHVLACDVGNTAIRLAHIHGDQVDTHRQLLIGDLGGLGETLAEMWQGMPEPKRLVAASVNPTGEKALEAAAAETLHKEPLLVGRDLPLPIDTRLPDPQNVGTDRLCAAVAAFDRLGVACVVADFGTAITVDCVSPQGVFMGGAILPGLRMSAAGLEEKTAALPEIQPSNPDWVFGRDTHQAIAGGIVFGARGALRYLVEAYATELGHWPTVIATGGDAELVCSDDSVRDLVQAIVPDLVLRGIAMAYYRSLVA